jgi:hypothetical protein
VRFAAVSVVASEAEDLQARGPVGMAGAPVAAVPLRDFEAARAHEGVLRFAGRAGADAIARSSSPLSSPPTRPRTPRSPTTRS